MNGMPSPQSDLVIVEQRAWPLLIVTFPSAASDDAVLSFIRAIDRAYARHERFAVVIDTTPVLKFPGASARALITDWTANAERIALERAYTVGTSVIMPSGPLRALVAAIQAVQRPATTTHWARNIREAIAWARQRLVERSIVLTPLAESVCAEMTGERARKV
jgi:hypothetical protein